MAIRWLHMATDSESHANHMRIDCQVFLIACHCDMRQEKYFLKIFSQKNQPATSRRTAMILLNYTMQHGAA